MNSKKLLSGALMLCSIGSWVSCDNPYDLDEKLPPNFGTTLMTYLEENDYQNYSQLVKDLGYEEALRGVALKTLFAADDEAFERFYQNNHWGVRKYEDLTPAQKKMLLYSSMLDNSLQLMNISSTTGANGVTIGNCMRRSTAASVYDTVPVITPDQMPDNALAWRYYRENGKTLVCMKDMSSVPMVFFIETFLKNKRITDEDIDFMFNHTIQRKSGDAYINGVLVKEGNLRSANGFLHKMHDVVTPLENMADIIARKENTKTFSRFLERYSAPYYAGKAVTDAYNYEYGTNVDSVFRKQYFSDRIVVDNDKKGYYFKYLPNGTTYYSDGQEAAATLKFDPGWNSFYSDDPNATSTTVALQQNMGVILVPSDAALEDYWENGLGSVLRENYGSWDNVPDHVLVKLINNNMLNSWVASVPSKFADITNSTQDPMNIHPEDVDSVWIGCNGAIYLTNKVFSPTEYVSVSFPALVNDNMRIFNWAIEQYQYGSYLNSLDAYYSLFIPTDDALLTYIDPVSYGETETKIYKFHYKADAQEKEERVWASVWRYNLETGVIGDSIAELGEIVGKSALEKRLTDILDNHIVVGNIESGKEYFRTKNGGVIRVKNNNGNIESVQSTMQIQKDKEIAITRVYDQTEFGNGKSYIINEEPLQTSNLSVCDILDAHPEFSEFYKLLQGSELFETIRKIGESKTYTTGSKTGNIATFNNYHYTVYVPTNESILELINSGQLLTWEKIGDMEESGAYPESEIKKMKNSINAFLRYHIQDNSLYIGMDYTTDGVSDTFTRNYETSIMDSKTQKFYTVKVNMTPSSISVTDGWGNTRKVITENGIYNLPAREYLISNGSLNTTAFAVVHQIDGPLLYKEDVDEDDNDNDN